MGLVLLTKAKQSFDILKLRWAFSNPISKSVINELLAPKNDGLMIDEFLRSYPQKPDGLSGIGYISAKRIVDMLKDASGSPSSFDETMHKPVVRRAATNVLQTVREYGIGRPQRFYAPLMIVWNITWRCNLRCKHCYEDAGSQRRGEQHDELSLKEKLAIVDQIAESNIPTLSLSGGEPLSHPDFWAIAERGKELGLYLSANSNGTLITDDAARRLAELDFAYVGVSIDAPTPEHHDQFRGLPGSWEKSIEGIKRLVKYEVPTLLSFTITSQSYHFLPGIFQLAKDLGMRKVMVYNFIPTGRGTENFDLDLTPEQREEALSMVYENVLSGASVCSTAPQLGRVFAEHGRPEFTPWAHAGSGSGSLSRLSMLSEIFGGCGAGRAYMAIQPDGRLTPCVYMPEIEIGNIRKDRIDDVWRNNELLLSISSRDGLKENCGICEYRAVCGGCRARAYAYSGDLLGPDSGCIRNKRHCRSR